MHGKRNPPFRIAPPLVAMGKAVKWIGTRRVLAAIPCLGRGAWFRTRYAKSFHEKE
jgi:hypothetical protein